MLPLAHRALQRVQLVTNAPLDLLELRRLARDLRVTSLCFSLDRGPDLRRVPLGGGANLRRLPLRGLPRRAEHALDVGDEL